MHIRYVSMFVFSHSGCRCIEIKYGPNDLTDDFSILFVIFFIIVLNEKFWVLFDIIRFTK